MSSDRPLPPSLPRPALEALQAAGAYPGDASARGGAHWIQTHISHVFLTGERVYKFRKAVDLGFVRFATRDERNEDCLREVALNRRLAPDVYLGVAPLVGDGAAVRVGPAEETLARGDPPPEHCVVMRRLPDGCDALSLLQRGELADARIDRLAELVARFHAAHGLGCPAPFEPGAWRERVRAPVDANFRLLRQHAGALFPAELLERAREAADAFVEGHADALERRRREGRAVDGHGDLHLQHVWFEGGDEEPRIIDCVEFDADLRRIDAASEVAFTAMDLVYRDAPRLAGRFLRRYARESDDFDLFAVVDYFTSYRAAVRAKVAALAAGDEDIDAAQRGRAAESARRHLELASDALAAHEAGLLLLVAGAVGTGKTTAAEALADDLHGVVISSDRVRKRLAGIPAHVRAAAVGRGEIYGPEATRRTYEGVLERAEPVVASGRVAVLDATWSRREHRADALARARAWGARAFLVETCCDPGVALERLAGREAVGTDASDAGPERLRASLDAFEPLADWPERDRTRLRTDAPGWRDNARALAARLQRRS